MARGLWFVTGGSGRRMTALAAALVVAVAVSLLASSAALTADLLQGYASCGSSREGGVHAVTKGYTEVTVNPPGYKKSYTNNTLRARNFYGTATYVRWTVYAKGYAADGSTYGICGRP